MHRNITPFLLAASLSSAVPAVAQTVLLDEQFTGGASTTGFTIQSTGSDCDWLYAPGGLTENAFNQDYGDTLPVGEGFDGDFVFLDSDECGGSGVTVDSYLLTPTFDASADGMYSLTFSHQFKARLQSFCRVEVSNGSAWTQVAYWTGDNVGFPNPTALADIDITAATGHSSAAQVRFEFSAGWDWWWAIDNVKITNMPMGIEERYAAQPLKVYPNPAARLLNVSYRGTDAITISVMDATGRMVAEHPMAKSIGVDGLREGAYTLILRDAAGRVVAQTPFMKH